MKFTSKGILQRCCMLNMSYVVADDVSTISNMNLYSVRNMLNRIKTDVSIIIPF